MSGLEWLDDFLSGWWSVGVFLWGHAGWAQQTSACWSERTILEAIKNWAMKKDPCVEMRHLLMINWIQPLITTLIRNSVLYQPGFHGSFFSIGKRRFSWTEDLPSGFVYDMSSGFNIRRETQIWMCIEWTAPQSQKQLAEMIPIRWASFEPIL